MDKFEIYKSKIISYQYGIKLIYDEIKYHHLRALGLMEFFGFDKFTYPRSWRYLSDIYNGTYILDRDLNKNNLPQNLVCITNQYYEIYESQFSINHTIRKYLSSLDKNLVIITDKKKFNIRGKQRPLDEEYFIECIFSYENLYNEVNKYYENYGLQLILQNTKNLYFQDMSLLIYEISNIEINTIKEFFENLFQFPYLPIWNYFTLVFGSKGQNLPLIKYDLNNLTNFFNRRLEIRNSVLKRILKKFSEQLFLEHIELLDMRIRKNKISNEIKEKIRKFKNKISSLNEELLERRFKKYFCI
ncbi:MAG: hypothetical protein ACTSPQ_17575 [Candidatus Helarchaeota archaeon]